MFKRIVVLCLALSAANCSRPGEVEPSPRQLLLEMNAAESYITTDEVASRVINKDPSLRLIDVRNKADYESFSLPGSVNIPINDLLLPQSTTVLDCERYDVVFYSNDDVKAAQAWQLIRRMGCMGGRYMRGGLNEWTAKFLSPPLPPATATAEAQEIYRFRRAACQYFIGGSEALAPEPYVAPEPAAPQKKTISVEPKPQATPAASKAKEEEGC